MNSVELSKMATRVATTYSKEASAPAVNSVWKALDDHLTLDQGGEVDEIKAGTRVLVLESGLRHEATGAAAMRVVKESPQGTGWEDKSKSVLVDSWNYSRHVSVTASSFLVLSGFDGAGHRVDGPMTFDMSPFPEVAASQFRQVAQLIGEIASNLKVATVVIRTS